MLTQVTSINIPNLNCFNVLRKNYQRLCANKLLKKFILLLF